MLLAGMLSGALAAEPWHSRLPDLKASSLQESELRDFTRELPKAELHTHVEGAVNPASILDMADEYGIAAPAASVPEMKRRIAMKPGETLPQFLKKFDPFRFVFDDRDMLRRLAYEMIQENAAENVLYTELRINPVKKPDRVPVGDVLDAILAGMEQGKREFGVDARLIASINRSYPLATAWTVAREAVARRDRGVVGLDLAGDEERFSPSLFAGIFRYARDNGLRLTVHAGEAAGPESIRSAREACGAERIGHGVRLAEDPALEQQFAREQVPLEMCPTSNLLINVVPDLRQYPLKRYLQRGIPVTINSDDRHIFDTTLSHEYFVLARHTDLTLRELQQISWNAVEESFLPENEKAALRERFAETMRAFERRWIRRLSGPASVVPD